MPVGSSTEQRRLYLVNAVATSRQRQLAVIFAAVALFAFAIAAPFARVPLAQIPAFITSYQAGGVSNRASRMALRLTKRPTDPNMRWAVLCVSFPKIISGRTGDATRPEQE
jgi:hypothetical protein